MSEPAKGVWVCPTCQEEVQQPDQPVICPFCQVAWPAYVPPLEASRERAWVSQLRDGVSWLHKGMGVTLAAVLTLFGHSLARLIRPDVAWLTFEEPWTVARFVLGGLVLGMFTPGLRLVLVRPREERFALFSRGHGRFCHGLLAVAAGLWLTDLALGVMVIPGAQEIIARILRFVFLLLVVQIHVMASRLAGRIPARDVASGLLSAGVWLGFAGAIFLAFMLLAGGGREAHQMVMAAESFIVLVLIGGFVWSGHLLRVLRRRVTALLEPGRGEVEAAAVE